MEPNRLRRPLAFQQIPESSSGECSGMIGMQHTGTSATKASKGCSSKSEPEVTYEEDGKDSPLGCNFLNWAQHSSQNSDKSNSIVRSNSLKQGKAIF